MPPEIRSSDVFLKSDLRNILRGIIVTQEAMNQMSRDPNPHFHAGFMAAMGAIETALDIRTGTNYAHLWHD